MNTDFWYNIKAGNQQGLKDLYDAYFSILFKFGSYIHQDQDQVKDAIHDLFVNIWNKRDRINIPDNSKNYLMTALRNEIYQQFNKASKTVLVQKFSEEHSEDLIFEQNNNNEERKKLVRKAMEKLTNKNREVIFLKYKDNLTNEEIAEVLGINYQSVRNLLYRAIQQLKKNLPVLSTFCFYNYL